LAQGRDTSPGVAVAFCLLAILTIVYAAWPAWRAFLPLEIDVNEPWNSYYADAVRAAQPLYPARGSLIVNNYPPLSFILVNALSAISFDALYVGRLLSLVAIVATAFAIWSIIRQFGGSRIAAGVGALWYCATLARFVDKYVGMNDPNLAGLAVMMVALAWLVRLHAGGRDVAPAILLMAAAGFYKHNLIAVPATAIVWLALGNVRVAARAALIGAAAAALGLALCAFAYGDAFFQSLLSPRTYSLRTAFESLGRLQWIAPALAVAALWMWHQRSSAAARFCLLFATAGFASHFLQKLGAGVDDNAQFELIAATAVGLGLAFENLASIPAIRRLGVERGRLIVLLILIARLLLSARMSPYLLLTSPEFRAEAEGRTAVVARETSRISAIPGPVVCSVMLVCRWAGKPFLYDAFYVQQSIETGRLTRADVEVRFRADGIRTETVDRRTVADWR
jgi:hypothetical protein